MALMRTGEITQHMYRSEVKNELDRKLTFCDVYKRTDQVPFLRTRLWPEMFTSHFSSSPGQVSSLLSQVPNE